MTSGRSRDLAAILLLVGAVALWPAAARAQEPTAPEGEPAAASSDAHADDADAEHGGSRISDTYVPLQLEGFPSRPKPLLELGSPFLGTGRIGRGFRLPGGAVWTPSFVAFGSFRSGVSVVDDAAGRRGEWANRLDLFGNLALTGTERLVVGVRPADETDASGARRFSGYASAPSGQDGFLEAFNLSWDTVTHLFFEGELGELLPALDVDDRRGLDLGFSVGRQPITFQEGLLIDDFIDAVGVTRNSLRPGNAVNLRVTGLFAWNQINRNTPSTLPAIRNLEAEGARLAGLFTEVDWRALTAALDVVYVWGGRLGAGPDFRVGDSVHAGISFVGRPGGRTLNLAIRLLASVAVDGSGAGLRRMGIADPARSGSLVFTEMSWTPHHTYDFFYVNGFWAIGAYRAAALDQTIPGPLARAGMLFAGPGLGNVPGAVSPGATDAIGGAVGHQRFLAGTRQQLLIEAGGRYGTADCRPGLTPCPADTLAAGARYQIAGGRRMVVVLDAHLARDWRDDRRVPIADGSRFRSGGRAELVIKF